jgi:hypothetical protein
VRRIECGCHARWLTSVSQPVSAEQAVAKACPCCGAPAARRCIGGVAGWLPGKQGERAYVDVCPARLEVQATLELVA